MATEPFQACVKPHVIPPHEVAGDVPVLVRVFFNKSWGVS